MGYLSRYKIKKLKFKYIGKNVNLSDKASFYRPENISVGDNSRIDDFVVLSAGEGGINIGRNVHIAVYSSLMGRGQIVVGDYANFSSRVNVYSSNDDYSGKFMTNPTIDEKFTGVDHRGVFIGRHVIIGCGSVILPGSKLLEGVAIGALSLVKAGRYKEFGIYGGVPARYVKPRSKKLLKLEKKFEKFIK